MEASTNIQGKIARLLSGNPAIAPQGLPDTAPREIGLVFQKAPDAAQNGGVHGGRYTARLRILLAGVVDAEQTRRARRNFRFRAMRKLVERT